MIDVTNVILTDDELEQCREFSQVSAATQQAVEFGQHTTEPRSQQEISRDNLIGKIAEVAFCKIMQENYDIDVPLDFNYYPRGQWDDQDAKIYGWCIDIKGTRKGGRWMLIEWNKLDFRQRYNNLCQVYAMFTVDWNRKTDMPTGRASYEGAITLKWLSEDFPSTRVIRRGEKLPGTENTYLQADNYGIRFRDLNKNLDGLVRMMRRTQPEQALTDNFKNPYTGDTTIEILARNEV